MLGFENSEDHRLISRAIIFEVCQPIGLFQRYRQTNDGQTDELPTLILRHYSAVRSIAR